MPVQLHDRPERPSCAIDGPAGIGQSGQVARDPTYPFVPRSTSFLRAGQFWAIPLASGRFACGRVLAVPEPGTDDLLPPGRRMFMAALMDWSSSEAPTEDAIAGAGVIANGMAHIKTIHATGGEILGFRDLALDDTRGLPTVSHRMGGTVYVYEGATRLRPATDDERETLPVRSTWGFQVIKRLAEHWFGDNASTTP